MFNITEFLKSFDSSIRWNVRIKSYTKKANKIKEFDKHRNFYSCSVLSALEFVESLKNIDEVLRQRIKIILLERQILELKNEVARVENQKIEKSLDSKHFNIYKISNMDDLAKNIIKDIQKSKNEKDIYMIFIDYVYCFTYKYEYNSIKTHIVLIRNAIRNSNLSKAKKDLALDIFRFSQRIHNYLSYGASQDRRENMTKTLDVLKVGFIENFMKSAKEYISKDIKLHETKKAFTHLTILLSLSTGRRLSELVTQANIEVISEYKIKVIGLAKKREDEVVEIKIPTLLLSANEVISAFEKMKTFIPKGIKSLKQKEKFAHNLVDFNLIDSKLWDKKHKFSNLRAIYAITCELLYNQNNINEENKKPQATYFQLVLGHNEFDFETCQHYFKRQILIKDFDIDSYLSKAKSAMH